MKAYYYLCLLFFFCMVFTACDSGDIYAEETKKNDKTITAQITLKGIKALPEENKLVLAAYYADEVVPVITQAITAGSENETVTVTLNYVPDDATRVTISVLNKTWREIYTYYDGKVPEGKTVSIPAQTINLLTYNRLQQQLFSQCVQCHGGSTSAAAGLYLTEGNSYTNLVSHPAVNSDKGRVTPGFISQSFLVDVLEGNATLRYTHTNISSLKDEDIALLKAWIESGAGKD